MSGFYVNTDDALVVTIWNGAAALTQLTVQLRMLQLDGTVLISGFNCPKLTADRTPNTFTFPLAPGIILGVVAGPPGVPLARGQCYVNISVARSASGSELYTQTLAGEYVDAAFWTPWPGANLRHAVDGPGYIATYQGSVPAAGANAVLNQPPHTRWRVMSVQVELTTNATAGNRYVNLDVFSGGTLVAALPAESVIIQSTQDSITWGAGMPVLADLLQTQGSSLPEDMYISGGVLKTGNQGVLATDQFSSLTALVEEWIDI